MSSLWNFKVDEPVGKLPVDVLKEQAAAFNDDIKSVRVRARVSEPTQVGKDLAFDLIVVAPYLAGYTLAVLEIRHPVEGYPVTVYSEYLEWGSRTAQTEEEYLSLLATALSDERLHAKLRGLMAHAVG